MPNNYQVKCIWTYKNRKRRKSALTFQSFDIPILFLIRAEWRSQ
ncbi:hypothetical protein NC652_021381 [Populus alba x Populus x berolinensis]|nr:hypothetical protein NC652_021381 [Populus alba x Populus x berolinensis]